MIDSTYTDIKIVDVLNGDFDKPNISTINKDIYAGNYFVIEDNTIYDADKNALKTLVQGDYFYDDSSTPIQWFIASDEKHHEFRDNKYNNTYLGDKGISFLIGDWNVDQGEKELTDTQKNNLPSLVIQMAGETGENDGGGINAWESDEVDQEKEFGFVIGIMVLEDDINNSVTGYDTFYETYTLITELIKEYRTSKQCINDNLFTNRQTRWGYDSIIYNEYKRPVVVGALLNTIKYR